MAIVPPRRRVPPDPDPSVNVETWDFDSNLPLGGVKVEWKAVILNVDTGSNDIDIVGEIVTDPNGKGSFTIPLPSGSQIPIRITAVGSKEGYSTGTGIVAPTWGSVGSMAIFLPPIPVPPPPPPVLPEPTPIMEPVPDEPAPGGGPIPPLDTTPPPMSTPPLPPLFPPPEHP